MAITLPDSHLSLNPTTDPKWNKFILFSLWILQFCFLGIFQLITFGLVSFGAANKAHEVVPWYFTLSIITIFIANAIILCTIIYEFFCGTSLTPTRYYRIQLVKSVYFLTLVILCLITGSGLQPAAGKKGTGSTSGGVVSGAVFVAPFWCALAYSVRKKRRVVSEFEEEEGSLGVRIW